MTALYIPIAHIVMFMIWFIYKLSFYFGKYRFIEDYGYNHYLFIRSILIEDLSVLSVIVILSIISAKVNRVRLIFTGLNSIIVIFYFVDILLVQSLFIRLTVPVVYEFFGGFSVFLPFLYKYKVYIIASVILLLCFSALRLHVHLKLRKKAWFILLLCLLIGTFMPYADAFFKLYDFYFDTYTSNVLKINMRQSLAVYINLNTYDKVVKQFPNLSKKFDDYYAGKPNRSLYPNKNDNQLPNIIILISESLSQVDSLRSGGIYNHFPLIDKIQSEGITLTNVISDGRNTSDALVSILLGIEPLRTSMFNRGMLNKFPPHCDQIKPQICKRNLICHAKQNGYKTLFVTNTPLIFENTLPWIKKIGFDYIEDSSSQFFSQFPIYTFSSPSDETLYKRVGEIITTERQPFLIVMLNVSLHQPYILPNNIYKISEDNQANLMNYVDNSTKDFYDKLKKDFFKNGVFLLIGDHRRMTPFSKKEYEDKAIDAYGRVVTSVIGKGFKENVVDNTPLNQTDLSTIVTHIVQGIAINERLETYNKGMLLGLNKTFTVNMFDYNSPPSGLIRSSQSIPEVVKANNNIVEGIAKSQNADERAFIVMAHAWLMKRMQQCKEKP
ncbi:membrane protein containing Sulfatase domain protein [Candidatus Magnetobacterium bavaricum]|uniref:Membrane protein containing Sulfatase domain protein n=1 Tax=Candidatus Magnetobacterium bavaricum TaxID=29290 RepID=A0A0F3GMB0_9BACT|nr:membrane protein containing Sulfatase domain protein [Candidatus Magnetobacterium bavaricum]